MQQESLFQCDATSAFSGPQPKSGQRVCILVLGMHRSGTSALTRVLSLLGASLPQNLLTPAPDNETGFWEPDRIVALNDRILSDLTTAWADWRHVSLDDPQGTQREDLIHELSNLITDEYGAPPLFVLKDPWICRLVPLYIDALAQLGVEPRFVLSIRNPLAVMRSLALRDEMTESYSGLLWLRHMLDAEAATRNRPRAFVSFDALLADWRQCAGRLVESILPALSFDVDCPEAEAIDAFLKTELRHHALSLSDLNEHSDHSPWLTDTYTALTRLETDPDDRTALAQLDRVRAEFEAATSALSAVSIENRRQRIAAEKVVARTQGEVSRLAKMVEEQDRDLAALRQEIMDATLEATKMASERTVLAAEVATLRAQVVNLDPIATIFGGAFALDLSESERIHAARVPWGVIAVRKSLAFRSKVKSLGKWKVGFLPCQEIEPAESDGAVAA